MFLAGVLMLTSCGSTESGLFTGAAFGSIIGSCIGGIAGGPRGHDVGTLVGLASGAAMGAAVGHANERSYYTADQASYSNSNYSSTTEDISGYSSNAVYDDVITMQPAVLKASDVTTTGESYVRDTTVTLNQLQEALSNAPVSQYAVTIQNVRFINDSNTEHISKGELVKIAFEMRNTSGSTLAGLVPSVEETTGNKRLMISPSTMIESLASKRALRYTAYVSAQKNLKTGTAHFRVSVKSNNAVISNVVEFDIPLN